MERYERIRKDGWKLLWRDAIEFDRMEAPEAKVISFFCKRNPNDPEINLNNPTPKKEISYDRVVTTEWLQERLNKTLQYKRVWKGDADIYRFVVLCNYLDQLVSGGYTRGIISVQELALLLPKKK